MGSFLEQFLLVCTGGAVGSGLRFLASLLFGAKPLTTFAVNITGAFLLGLLMGSRLAVDARWRSFLGIGLLGGYTTFSTMALEALVLQRTSGPQQAFLLLAVSAGAGLASVFFGSWVGQRLSAP